MIVEFEGDRYEVDDDTTHMARDADGSICCYSEAPTLHEEAWVSELEWTTPQLVDSPNNTWKHSLVEVAPEIVREWLLVEGLFLKGVFSATEYDAQEYLKQFSSSFSIKPVERMYIK